MSPEQSARPVPSKDAGRAVVTDRAPLLRLEGVGKRFGPVEALRGVDLDLVEGEVTALVGDNGAGKSTLIKAIAGIHTIDAGQMYWNGEAVHIRNPKDASTLGIETVYQDLALCDNLDIVQNMFLGREELHTGVLNEAAMEQRAKATLGDLSVTTVKSVRQQVSSLSGGQRQAVAVARAVMWDARLVILDEPTAALGVSQTAMVLDLITRLSAHGIAVLVVSHNLNDVFSVADRIAVMHLGSLAHTAPAAELSVSTTVELITTGALSDQSDQES